MEERIISSNELSSDSFDNSIRPQYIKDYRR